MSQNEIPNHQEDGLSNIDELLNSFLDGELDARHQTEVQRLIKHDEQIAKRLLELQKCKRLVSSLPYAEAPDGMLEDIKASLEEKELTLPAARAVSLSAHQQRQGARHLLVRRLTAAVAMIGLAAVLAAVIYSIVAPQVTITDMSVAVEKTEPKEVAVAGKPAEITPFTSRLELKTASLPEVAAFLNKAIEFSIPSNQRTAAVPGRPRESFTLICSRQNLRSFLADVGTIWDKLDSATLYIDTDRPEGQIVIDAVAPEQIIEIAKQDDFQTQIKTAKFFAAMNNVAERLPSKEVMVAIDDSTLRRITIPKPVLTSSEKPVTKTAGERKAEQKVLLTIVVTGSE